MAILVDLSTVTYFEGDESLLLVGEATFEIGLLADIFSWAMRRSLTPLDSGIGEEVVHVDEQGGTGNEAALGGVAGTLNGDEHGVVFSREILWL